MISIQSVSKAFRPAGGGPPNQVLEGVSLHVPPSCLYGLIGPGAAGKSILLKMIVGLMKPDAGSITVDGVDVTQASELDLQKMRLKFGMLFQNNALFDHMTVGDNIAFPLRRLTDLGEDQIKDRVMERLSHVALTGFEGRLPAGLSGGQKKRVGVARATITKAPIVLYDEPAAGLDPVTSQKIFELLREEQRASGATVVMVSSDLDRLLTVTDRIGMMYRGRLIFDGTTHEAQTSTEPRVRQFVHGLTEGPL
ncbi:MAG: ATP-binding cassette domain-containing protein [Labilithrix sp.]|nr:ATP-binding cassette domain-containing protein [Labilithrix sp.]MBX3223790.1 ATP-binding cassette domain-containing protein [Labilithrix sp.]